MLALKELQLKNFLSHSDTKIEFKPNQKMLIDGKSGAGKSSIVEAIVWVLYGKGRTDNRSLVRQGEKSGKVVLVLSTTETGEVLKIEREATLTGKNTLKVSKQTKKGNFLPVKVNGLRALQEHLETEILNSSYLLFINSIVYPQDSIDSFVKQTAVKRKEIILEIANAQNYDEYYDKAKEALAKTISDTDKNDALILNLQSLIKGDKLETTKTDELEKDYATKSAALEVQKKSLEELSTALSSTLEKRNKANEVKSKIADATTNKKILESQIEEANTSLIGLLTRDLSEEKKELEKLPGVRKDFDKIEQTEEAMRKWDEGLIKLMNLKPIDFNFDTDINYLNEQLISALKVDKFVCPETKKECPYMNKDKNDHIERLKDKLKSKTEQKTAYLVEEEKYVKQVETLGIKPEVDIASKNFTTRELKKLELLENEIKKTEETMEERKKDYTDVITQNNITIKKVDADIEELSGGLPNTDVLDTEINTYIAKQMKLQVSVNDLSVVTSDIKYKLSTAQGAAKRIEKNEASVTKLKEENVKLLDEGEGFKLLKGAFSQNGVKAIVIDYIIPRLEEKINNILERLSSFRIRLETQKSSVKGDSTIEGLFITIFNEQGLEFNFDNYSGGERLKIIVAISEALAEIQKIGFRVLDELFIGLDEESTEKFVEVMATLQERFDQMLCISHLRNIKDTFDEKIEIVKNNGISKIA